MAKADHFEVTSVQRGWRVECPSGFADSETIARPHVPTAGSDRNATLPSPSPRRPWTMTTRICL